MVSQVSISHPAYDRNLYSWTMVRDSIEGEAAIKSKGTMYLPMPAAMQYAEYSQNPNAIKTRGFGWRWAQNDPIMSKLSRQMLDPNYDTNPAYSAYLMRSQFPEIVSFILRGLMGLAMSDAPTIKIPRQMEYLLERATPTGMSLVELYAKSVIEVLATGRFTLTLAITDGQIEIVPYIAESLINWKARRAYSSKASDAQFIVLEEWEDDPDDFSHDYKAKYFVLRDLGPTYVVETYDDRNLQDPESVITPSYKGKTLPYVPFVTLGSITNGLNPNPIPLYSIASTAIQIYMRSADLGNSEFVSCNPTLVMTGVDKESAPLALGSTVTLTIPDPMAKVYYPRTDTSALAHVMSHINDLYERAIYFGAQLLDSSKKAAESAETTRLKQASSGATLSSVIMNVAQGFEKILKMQAEWMGIDGKGIEFKAITEFMAPALTAQEQKAMVESWVAGAISKVTLLDNFRRAGVLPAGSSVDDELKRLEEESAEREERQRALEAQNQNNLNQPQEDDDDAA